MSFEDKLKAQQLRIGAALRSYLSELGTDRIAEGMRYATNGGKRLRGFLVCNSAELFEPTRDGHLLVAAAIECIHAYSLVHDDLPCMDDDDLRRGMPTVHKKWDEATAVLVGDGLQSFAFELLSRDDVHSDPEIRLALIRTLAKASGAKGMVLGQAQDIVASHGKSPLNLADITALQANKTGALIGWSVEAGAILGGSDPEPLRKYAHALGLAFQITDDILDETGEEAKTGKRLKKDADAGKATFVSLLGLEGARNKARALAADAIDALCIYDARADSLRDAARFVISREH
ncbi:MAG: polyprenyl synthetase family protein [Boseongicola sp.]